MSDPAIAIEKLCKTVSATFSLGPLSLVVPRGTVCALVGPNGAGKTTLLNLLMGIGPASGGRASVLGHDLGTSAAEITGILSFDLGTAAVEIKRRAALVSPEISYRAWGTVGRAIDFVSGFYPDWDPARCEELRDQLGLKRTERIEALSFGSRMKLSLLMALSRNAELLLLDEPTIGLDPLARQALFAQLLGFMQNENRTIVISSHQLTELERIADHVAVINQGQVIVAGAIPDVLERYQELDVLLGTAGLDTRPGIYPLARAGDRARILVDRSCADTSGLETIGARALTLEELFVALIRSHAGLRWRARMAA
jgi:ABC-2 type transport system ATP-binding protein